VACMEGSDRTGQIEGHIQDFVVVASQRVDALRSAQAGLGSYREQATHIQAVWSSMMAADSMSGAVGESQSLEILVSLISVLACRLGVAYGGGHTWPVATFQILHVRSMEPVEHARANAGAATSHHHHH
jgi:hypothetical protein